MMDLVPDAERAKPGAMNSVADVSTSSCESLLDTESFALGADSLVDNVLGNDDAACDESNDNHEATANTEGGDEALASIWNCRWNVDLGWSRSQVCAKCAGHGTTVQRVNALVSFELVTSVT